MKCARSWDDNKWGLKQGVMAWTRFSRHWKIPMEAFCKHDNETWDYITSRVGWRWGVLVPWSWLRATFICTFLVDDLVQWNLVVFITQVKCLPPFVRDVKFIDDWSCNSHWIHKWLCRLWSTEKLYQLWTKLIRSKIIIKSLTGMLIVHETWGLYRVLDFEVFSHHRSCLSLGMNLQVNSAELDYKPFIKQL